MFSIKIKGDVTWLDPWLYALFHGILFPPVGKRLLFLSSYEGLATGSGHLCSLVMYKTDVLGREKTSACCFALHSPQ